MKQKTLKLIRRICRLVGPPPKLTVSEWADKYRQLSSEYAAEPGQWRTDRAPYQREIMDSFNAPRLHKIVRRTFLFLGNTETHSQL